MKKSKKLSPLEELRIEKDILKTACAEKEEYMTSCLSYVSNNFGSILFTSVLRNLGLGGKSSSSRDKDELIGEEDNTPPSSTILQTVWNGLQITYPYIKEIAQPLILGLITSKIKNIFSKKNKKGDKEG